MLKKLLLIISCFLFVATSVFIFLGIIPFHFHESAYSVLYAENILENGLYSPSFGGREVTLFSWALPLSFFSIIFGPSIFTHALGTFTFYFLYIFLLFVFSRQVNLRTEWFYLSICLLSINFVPMPIRYRITDQLFLWPMNSYGVYDLILLVSTIFFTRLLCLRKHIVKLSSFNINTLYLIPLISFLIGSTGTRGSLIIGLPIVVCLIYYIISPNFSDFTFYHFRSFNCFAPIPITSKTSVPILFLLFLISGLVVNKFIGQDSFQPTQSAMESFSSLNLGLAIATLYDVWMQLLGSRPDPSLGNIFSPYGLILITKFFFGNLILILIFRARNKFDRTTIFYFLNLLVISLIVGLVFVLGRGNGQDRYMIHIYLASIPVVCASLNSLDFPLKRLFSLAFISTVIILSLNTIFSYTMLSLNYDQNLSKNSGYQVSRLLNQYFCKSDDSENCDIPFGFALGWQSDALSATVMSNGKVRLGLLDLKGGSQPSDLAMKPHWHSDKKWYSFRSSPVSYILTSQYVADTFDNADLAISNCQINVIDQQNFGHWRIHVTDNSLFYSPCLKDNSL